VPAPDIVVKTLELRHIVFRRHRERIDVRIGIAYLAGNFPDVTRIHSIESVERTFPPGTFQVLHVNDGEYPEPHSPSGTVILGPAAVKMRVEADPCQLAGALQLSRRVHLDIEGHSARTLNHHAGRPGRGVLVRGGT